MGLTEKSFLERWAEMGITPTKRDINVNFTEEEFDMIHKYQKATDSVAVQAAILNAISLALDHADD